MSATQTMFEQPTVMSGSSSTIGTQTINTINLIKQEAPGEGINYFKLNRALNPITINPVNIEQHLKNAKQKRMNKQKAYSDAMLMGDMIDAKRHQIRMLRNAKIIDKFNNTPPPDFNI